MNYIYFLISENLKYHESGFIFFIKHVAFLMYEIISKQLSYLFLSELDLFLILNL